MNELQEFTCDRNAALLSLDKSKIEDFFRKWEMSLPKDEKAFWAAVYKARIEIVDMPEHEKEISRQWLHEHGFSTYGGSHE